MSCLSILVSSHALRAEGVVDDHIKPTITDGFDNTGLGILAAGALATALAQSKDYEMRDNWKDHQRMCETTSKYGDFLGTGLYGAAVAIAQLYFDNDNGKAHTEALIDTALVTAVAKYAGGRSRPGSDEHNSMPSGHTSTTFATATSLTYSYGWKAAIPAYSLAVFTAASRWADDRHWLSDTVAGATLGIFLGRATWFHHGKLVAFTPEEGGLGVAWNYKF